MTQNSDGNVDLPWVIDVSVFMTPKSETGWSSPSVVASLVNNAVLDTDNTSQNNEISWDVLLAAGTWTFEVIHRQANNRGIYSVQIDSVEEGTIDGYDASVVDNVQDTVAGITIDASGIHELKLKMATKNGSSSGYVGSIQHIQLRRTA